MVLISPFQFGDISSLSLRERGAVGRHSCVSHRGESITAKNLSSKAARSLPDRWRTASFVLSENRARESERACATPSRVPETISWAKALEGISDRSHFIQYWSFLKPPSFHIGVGLWVCTGSRLSLAWWISDFHVPHSILEVTAWTGNLDLIKLEQKKSQNNTNNNTQQQKKNPPNKHLYQLLEMSAESRFGLGITAFP